MTQAKSVRKKGYLLHVCSNKGLRARGYMEGVGVWLKMSKTTWMWTDPPRDREPGDANRSFFLISTQIKVLCLRGTVGFDLINYTFLLGSLLGISVVS